MLKKLSLFLALVASSITAAEARDQIRAVGSSTVYPFVTVAAEEFGKKTNFRTPIVESTGTGGGFKLFCSGTGKRFPDISNASRAIKKSEKDLCAKNGIIDITEIKIGYDGIVLANLVGKFNYNLTKEQIFKALAKKVPSNGKLIDNPYRKWSEIDPSLPNKKIEVYGPPPTSGTRDAFVELVMEKACVNLPEFKATFKNKKQRKKACHILREDGSFIEAGENDNLIVQKLRGNPDALGMFGFSHLDQNRQQIQGSKVSGVEPTFENIAGGKYPVSRPLFVYAKNDHFDKTKGLREFVSELIDLDAIGDEGYLTFKGLIPLADSEYKQVSKSVKSNL